MSAEIHAVAGDGAPRLTDLGLFRQQAYVDGAWIDADSGETIDVTNPGASYQHPRVYAPRVNLRHPATLPGTSAAGSNPDVIER